MGSSPNLSYGQVPTAGQWNGYFKAKQDELGYVPLNTAGGSMTGALVTALSTTSAAGLNLPEGAAPGTPRDGDMWTTNAGLFVQINGSTVGPLSGGGGISIWKQAADLATAAALPANTYANGSSGVGATLTANANGALTVDGTAVTGGQRILVKDETASAHNGIYSVTQTGNAAAPYVLTRSSDFDTVAEVEAGSGLSVLGGSALLGTFWVMTTVVTALGTNPIVFSEFAPSYTAGSGLQLTGTQFSIASNANLPGVPTASTATPGTNTDQIATTAFVLANSTNSKGLNGIEAIKTANYTVQTADEGKNLIANSATAIIFTFSAATTLGSTWMALIKNVGAGALTLAPNGSETINGYAHLVIATGQSVLVSSNGTLLRTVITSEKTLYTSQFGLLGDGSDETTLLQAAVTAAAGKTLVFDGLYSVSASISPASNSSYVAFAPNCGLKLLDGTKHGLFGNTVSNVIVDGLTFTSTNVAPSASYVGLITFYASTNCVVKYCNVIGASWSSIVIWDSVNCIVSQNYIGAAIYGATSGESVDILVFRNSNYNKIIDNICNGGALSMAGVFIMDDYQTPPSTPTGNIVSGNTVGEHSAYGIGLYLNSAYDAKTIISNNVISDILGTAISGISGAGIYIPVPGAGGILVQGNTVSNCCRSTSNFSTLAMGSIAYTGSASVGSVGVQIVGNTINAPRGPGIAAATSLASVLISGNTITCTDTSTSEGDAIEVINVQNPVITDNIIYHKNSNFYAIAVLASGVAVGGVKVSGNSIVAAGSKGGISCDILSSGSLAGPNISGNSVIASSGSNGIYCNDAGFPIISNNYVSGGAITLQVVAGVLGRYIGNVCSSSSGSASIIFTGTSTSTIAAYNAFNGTVTNSAGITIV